MLVVFELSLFACGSSETPTSTVTAGPPTKTLTATATPIPPTATTAPSEKPSPSVTSEPIATLEPTTTASPPSPTTLSDPSLYLSLDTGLESLSGLTFSDNGRYLAASDQNGTVSVWDMSNAGHLFDMDVFDLQMTLFSPDGEYLATLSSSWVKLWLVKDGSLVADYPCIDELEVKIQFIPSGDLAITGIIGEEQVNLTYLPSEEQQNLYSQNPDAWITQATLSPDGDVIALGRSDGAIELYNVAKCQLVWKVETHADWVLNLAFSPDNQLLASDSLSFDPSIKVWKVKDGTLVNIPENEKWDAGRLAFSPDGSLLTSYSSYGTKLWRTDDWTLYALRPSFVRFSPDGAFFAEPENVGMTVWYTQNAAQVQSFFLDGWRGVAFLPSDLLPLVALGMVDGVVEIYQLDIDGETVQVLGTATPPPAQDFYIAIDSTYGEVLGNQYVEWNAAMQLYLMHGFANGAANFDPLTIQTRRGKELGTAIATLRLLNLHRCNQNYILIPLAIELPDGTLFMPGQGDPVPAQEMKDLLIFLREEEFLGRSITVLIASDIEAAKEASGMSEEPWQDDLITAYQESWKEELDEMLKTGQAVSVEGQDLMLVPFQMWLDLFEPLVLP